MIQVDISGGYRDFQPELATYPAPFVYTREAFRAILARQPEWKIRAALEEGNIPRFNVKHVIEWLEEKQHTH
ncbi:hypothetical protein C5614_19655 [Massilia phosphatilytica]|nr:hypothetical protein C5614_19655 [Massilia phosphatilytica]